MNLLNKLSNDISVKSKSDISIVDVFETINKVTSIIEISTSAIVTEAYDLEVRSFGDAVQRISLCFIQALKFGAKLFVHSSNKAELNSESNIAPKFIGNKNIAESNALIDLLKEKTIQIQPTVISNPDNDIDQILLRRDKLFEKMNDSGAASKLERVLNKMRMGNQDLKIEEEITGIRKSMKLMNKRKSKLTRDGLDHSSENPNQESIPKSKYVDFDFNEAIKMPDKITIGTSPALDIFNIDLLYVEMNSKNEKIVHCEKDILTLQKKIGNLNSEALLHIKREESKIIEMSELKNEIISKEKRINELSLKIIKKKSKIRSLKEDFKLEKKSRLIELKKLEEKDLKLSMIDEKFRKQSLELEILNQSSKKTISQNIDQIPNNGNHKIETFLENETFQEEKIKPIKKDSPVLKHSKTKNSTKKIIATTKSKFNTKKQMVTIFEEPIKANSFITQSIQTIEVNSSVNANMNPKKSTENKLCQVNQEISLELISQYLKENKDRNILQTVYQSLGISIPSNEEKNKTQETSNDFIFETEPSKLIVDHNRFDIQMIEQIQRIDQSCQTENSYILNGLENLKKFNSSSVENNLNSERRNNTDRYGQNTKSEISLLNDFSSNPIQTEKSENPISFSEAMIMVNNLKKNSVPENILPINSNGFSSVKKSSTPSKNEINVRIKRNRNSFTEFENISFTQSSQIISQINFNQALKNVSIMETVKTMNNESNLLNSVENINKSEINSNNLRIPDSKDYIEMYKNLKDSVKTNQSPGKKKIVLEIIQSQTKHQDDLTPKQRLPNFTQFVEFFQNMQYQHQKCGPNCKHLKRFYEKLGMSDYEKKLNRFNLKLSRNNIGSLPKISKRLYQS